MGFRYQFGAFSKTLLHILAMKPTPLSGGKVGFIIDYLKMSTRAFAELFGVTHAAILKWEQEKSRMNPSTEVCLRLYILNHLKVADSAFRKLFLKISPQDLANAERDEIPLEIDAEKIAC